MMNSQYPNVSVVFTNRRTNDGAYQLNNACSYLYNNIILCV